MRYGWIFWLPCSLAAQGGSFSLASQAVYVGSAPGLASVELTAPSAGASWTASSNASWLHLAPASTNGAGSALIQFSYDTNPNASAQSGTLTIAGLSFTVTQAGSGFVPLGFTTTLISQGLNLPYGIAIDNSGNLYIADTGHNAIQEWVAATQQMAPLVNTGLNEPHGVAVDAQGNVYIADSSNNAIKQWSPATQQITTLVSSGLNFPLGVAVDSQGNVYIADFGNNAIKQWSPLSGQVTTVVGSGINNPTGVAVDALGNVYIADFRNNAIKQWNPTTQQFTPLITQGLSFPNAVALDGQGNIYLFDGNNNALKEFSAAGQVVSTLLSSGVNGSFGVATDGLGNFYLANTGAGTILKYSSAYLGLSATNLNEGPQAGTDSVGLQLLGGSLPAASSDQSWLTITGTSGAAIGFAFQTNTSIDSRTAHIILAGQQITVTQSGDVPANLGTSGNGQAGSLGGPFPALLQVTVTDASGSPIVGVPVTFTVLPGPNGAGGTFAATPAMPILTDQNGNATAPPLIANGIAGQFTVTASAGTLTASFSLMGVSYALASNSIVVGSAAGGGTVEIVTTGPWTAASNAAWLQVAAGSTSGLGGALIQFTFNANLSPAPQTGTLTIAGLTFTVIQAGAGYVAVAPVTTLVSSGLNQPQGVAVDGQGNVYIADTGNNQIKQWNPNTLQTLVLSSGLNNPKAVAVSSSGSLYVGNTGNNVIVGPSPANATLVSGLNGPSGVAVDAQGNVYYSDTGNNAVDEWSALGQQASVLAGAGLSGPWGVAVDGLANVYFADTGNNAIKEWVAASGQVNTLVAAGLSGPTGVAVDGQGNVYLADTGNNAIKEWNVATRQSSALVSTGLSSPAGIAVDVRGNLYIADTNNSAIKMITPGWLAVSATSLNEPYAAGTDSVTAQVLPAGLSLTATSDQSWLTVTGISGGVIAFSFSSNSTGANRIAHIIILGLPVTVTQSGDLPATLTKCAGDGQSTAIGQPFATALQVCVADAVGNPVPGVPVTFAITPGATGAGGAFGSNPPMPILANQNGTVTAPVLTANGIGGAFTVTASLNALSVTFTLTNLVYALGASSAIVGNAAGSGSVLLLATGPWTATSNASWLQLSAASTSGTDNALIQFSYSANPSVNTQTGTLTISGLSYTVTQAGASFTSIGIVKALVSSGLKAPHGVAVDGAGNVYIADTTDSAIKKWTAATQQVSTLVPSGLNSPTGVAVDSHGNVYIADCKNNAVKEWNISSGQVTSLVYSGLSYPTGVAVDSQGNVYFSDAGHNEIKEWIAATEVTNTLVSSGLSTPQGVALDAEGNLYFADSKNNAIKEWRAAGKSVATLVSGLNAPYAVAVDGDGNVYVADTGNNAIKEWNPSTGVVTALVSTGLKAPSGVAVDGQGNVYIADTSDNAIKEYSPVEIAVAGTRSESAPAGTDAIAVQILPAGTSLSATSSATWLTITGTAGGAIEFSFTANTSVNSRAAKITVLGQEVVTVTQNGDIPASITKIAGNSQSAAEGHAFATALKVQVKDAAGNAIAGAAVTFTCVPGSKGSSGTFASSPPMPILTTTAGYATAPSLTANNTAGTFTATAGVSGLSANTTFSLTITKP